MPVAVLALASWLDEYGLAFEDTSPPLRHERHIVLDLSGPMDDAESNARLWLSLNQLFGKGSDLSAERHGWDGRPEGRIGQLLALGYLNLLIGYYSHEFGHARVDRALGPYEWSIDLRDWSMGWPVYHGYGCRSTDSSEEIRSVAGGLNQEEYDAYLMHEKTLQSISFDEGFAFICRKLSDVTYDTYADFNPDVDHEGDVWRYKRCLSKRGIHLSDEAFLLQAVIADLLSVKLWDSFRALRNYAMRGERTTRCTTFNLRGVEITPPLVNFYMTPDGGFYNFVCFLNPAGRKPVEIALGTDVDFIGDGKLDRLRVGAEYNDLRPWVMEPCPRIGVFAYLDVDRSDLGRRGLSAGVDISCPVTEKSTFVGRYEFNTNDVVENVAKGKKNGSRISLGLGWRF